MSLKDEQFSSKLLKVFFFFTNYIIISLQVTSSRTMKTTRLTSISVLAPGVVVQLQVSLSTDQDLVAFQVHPADLPRRFQQSLKVDNYYQP